MTRREALAALVALPEATRISVARLTPTDVLVLEVPGPISIETAERIKASMLKVCPEQKCIVLSDGVHLKVLRQ